MDAGAFGARLGPKDGRTAAKGESHRLQRATRQTRDRWISSSSPTTRMEWAFSSADRRRPWSAAPQGRKWYDEINSGSARRRSISSPASKGQLPKGFPRRARLLIAARGANHQGAEELSWVALRLSSAMSGLQRGRQQPHRNVIWRDSGAKAKPHRTLHHAATRSSNPRDLWKWMAMRE
jgi:hypothetical protein